MNKTNSCSANELDERRQSEKLCVKTEILYDGTYYDISSWMKKHPGGKIIEIFASTEQDALHAIQQFHFRSTERVMKIMKTLPQRAARENEILKSRGSTRNDSLTADFLKLFHDLQTEGYFDTSQLHVAIRFMDIFLLLTIGNWIYFSSENFLMWLFGLCLLGLALGRAGFLGHECGHHSLTGNSGWDRTLLSLIYGLIDGLSGSYWTNQHSRHHAMPQHIQNDVDLRTLPLMAFNKKIVKNPNDGKTFLIRNQKWLFLFNSALVISAWRFYLHPRYAVYKRRYFELLTMLMHTAIFYYFYGIIDTFLMFWLGSVYMVGNFTLNHSHMPVTEVSTHWVEQTLVHTANIRSSYFGWVDYWMGNLNYQIEHHLFPTMPQFKNKFIRDRVKALARKHNLPYNLMDYGEAVVKSFHNLDQVSRELM